MRVMVLYFHNYFGYVKASREYCHVNIYYDTETNDV